RCPSASLAEHESTARTHEEEAGPEACVRLAARPPETGGEAALEGAFGRAVPEVERDWRRRLDDLRAA
ncbi:MAG: hypothetical protein M3340_18635, partial [Actinomycetota bacterium]|nr:hypothetical protein [Actinomycetota bacterium]